MACILACAGVLCACGAGQVFAAAPTTAPNIVTDAEFGADVFSILPWDWLHGSREPWIERRNGLESIAECGFTLGGFVQARDLPLCEKLGLKAILAPPGGRSPFSDRTRTLSDAEIDDYVRQIVASGAESKAVLGYFIMDEPGTRHFASLAKAVAAVRKYAPGKLAYINLFPGYATIGAPDTSQLGAASYREYLERYVTEVKPQFLSYDNYRVQYSDDLQDARVGASYYQDLLEVRSVAIANRLPFWNIVSSNQIRPPTPPPSPANLMFQAYTTLAVGGRGLSWYTYFARGYGYAPVDAADRRTDTWDYLRAVNRQVRALGPLMNRLRSTGVYFSQPAPAEGLPLLPGRLVKDVQARTSVRKPGAPTTPVLVGEFAHEDGTDYVMIVNLSLQYSTNIVPVLQTAARSMQIVSSADARMIPLDPKPGHWLVAGQGVLVRLQG